jgi:hypothetical protein
MSRSTLLSRLAIALLVALGFVVPVAAPERDQVVQTSGSGARELARVSEPSVTRELQPLRVQPSVAGLTAPCVEAPVTRRYLLHHAWLC